MSRRLHALLCVLALAGSYAVVSVISGLAYDAANPPLPPCPTEDSLHCYWDSSTMGNGLGEDVVTP